MQDFFVNDHIRSSDAEMWPLLCSITSIFSCNSLSSLRPKKKKKKKKTIPKEKISKSSLLGSYHNYVVTYVRLKRVVSFFPPAVWF